MSAEQIDEYPSALDEPTRATLQTLRRTIVEIVLDAEQVISYRVPAFTMSKSALHFAVDRPLPRHS